MKTILVLCALVAVTVSLPAEFYSSQYDNFNAQELVENVRLLKNYAKCFLGEGPCTPEGTDFKKYIPEAVRSKCAKCSPKQRELVRTVIHGFQDKLPDLWQRLVDKEDPNGEFKETFDEFLHGTD